MLCSVAKNQIHKQRRFPIMTAENPINLQLKSFARFDDAMDMCDLLNRETGNEYTVMSDNHLGFTVSRIKESRPNEQESSKNHSSMMAWFIAQHSGALFRIIWK